MPSFLSYETERSINVSQGAISSSPAGEQVQVENSILLIRDSLGDDPVWYQNGRARSPQQEEDQDDLYSVTPDAKLSQNPLKPLDETMQNSKEAFISKRQSALTATLQPAITNEDSQFEDSLATINAKKALPSKRTTRAEPAEVAIPKLSQALINGKRAGDRMGKLSKPSKPSGQATSAHPSTAPAISTTSGTQTNTNTSSKAPSSALLALLARKKADASPTTSFARSGEGGRLDPKRRDLAINSSPKIPTSRTLVENQGSDRADYQRPTRSRWQLASANSPEVSIPHVPLAGAASRDECETRLSSVKMANQLQVSAITSASRQGLPKRPASPPPSAAADESRMFDLPTSSDGKEGHRPGKKARTDGTAEPKQGKPPLSKNAKMTQVQRRGVEVPKATPNKHKHPDTSFKSNKMISSETAGRYGLRSRMKPESSSKAEREVSSLVDETIPEVNGQNATRSRPRSRVTTVASAMDSLDDFGQSVVEYDDDHVADTSANKLLGPVKSEKVEADTLSHKNATRDSNVSVVAGNEGPSNAGNAHPTGSQQNAIEIPDQLSSSSSVSSATHRVPASPATSFQAETHLHKIPKTPSVCPSSPPHAPDTHRQERPGFSNTARKPAIIGFDISGPRNQGQTAINRTVLGPMSNNHTSFDSVRDSLNSSTKGKFGHETGRRKGPSSIATSAKSTKTTQSSAPSNVAENVTDALASFIRKPQNKRSSGTKDDTLSEKRNVIQTKESRFPPIDDGFFNIDDFDEPTLVNDEPEPTDAAPARSAIERTASQLAMPPPAPKSFKPETSHGVPTVPHVTIQKSAQNIIVRTPQIQGTTKRAYTVKSDDLRQAKRSRLQANNDDQLSKQEDDARSMKPVAAVDQMLNIPQKAYVPEPQPIKRAFGKSTRVASYGSQRVDSQGSPVPDGMTVAVDSTALETFSQQAGVRSSPVPAVASTSLLSVQPVPMATGDEWVPTSHQPQVLSSNRKQQPSAPQEPSKVVTSLTNVTDHEKFVVRRQQMPDADPFASSQIQSKQRRPKRKPSTFAEQLKRIAATETQGKPRNLVGEVDLVEDADKTLVEPEMQPIESMRPQSSSPSSSDTSTTTEESTASQTDLAIWRNALKPHQLNIFDELVIVSHRLVRHLVDRETAAMQIVEDFRRSGTNLVEIMELNHAKQHQAYVEGLKERKCRLKRGLIRYGRKLQECAANMLISETDHALDRNEGGRVLEDKLRDVMAEYC